MRARKALPILIRQAKAEQPIYYSDLASELSMPNPRNLDYVLGHVGDSLIRLGKEWGVKVPPIQCLVVNKKDKIPGKGISWSTPRMAAYKKMSSRQKREIVRDVLRDIYGFDRWDEVLKRLTLKPVDTGKVYPKLPVRHGIGGEGESEDHKKLKLYVAGNPKAINLPSTVCQGTPEFEFRSGDTVDVMFVDRGQRIGVEVKSMRSDVNDIARGLFQCVKYGALIEAEQRAKQEKINSRVLLVLGGKLPDEIRGLKNLLGIEVVEDVVVPNS